MIEREYILTAMMEYQKLKQKEIEEGWACDTLPEVNAASMPSYYLDKCDKKRMDLNAMYQHEFLGEMRNISVSFGLSQNTASQNMDVVILNDVVLIEYSATLALPLFPIGRRVH